MNHQTSGISHISWIAIMGLFAGLASAYAGEAKPSVMGPAARLKVVETKTIWKAPVGEVGSGKKKRKRPLLGAGRARFSPDGKRLAWRATGSVEGGGLFMAEGLKVKLIWKAKAGDGVESLAWSRSGDLAACVRVVEGEKVTRSIVLSRAASGDATELAGTTGAYRLAWRGDGKVLAYSTKTSLMLLELASAKTGKLVAVPAAEAPPKGPAFEDLIFYKQGVIARRVGTMRYLLVLPGGKKVDLGECRGVAPDPERDRLYLVPWLTGPAGIPRGAGVAWVDPEAKEPRRKVIVADRPAPDGGKPYWLPDVWDWHYPSSLRVSSDGRHLTFAGVRAGVLSKTPWREFCIWRLPTGGSDAPKALCSAGNIPKRFDVGDTHCIGWRYTPENSRVFFDLVRGKAWRLPKGFYVQRANTDALPEALTIAAARGGDVTVFRLAPEK